MLLRPEMSLIVTDFTNFSMAVHVIISFLVSFWLICFLFLFIGIPKAAWDAMKKTEKTKKRKWEQKRENYMKHAVQKNGKIRD